MIITRLLRQLAPYECLGCGAEGQLLCSGCATRLIPVPERCYRCRTLSAHGKTCQSCRHTSSLFSIRSATIYRGLAKELIWKLKFNSARDAAEEIAAQLLPLIPPIKNAIIVPVPTATSRARQRGYDQAQLIAKALARRTGLPYTPALRRLGQHHQVGSTRDQRRAQLKDAYRCVHPSAIQNQHVILIDDVLTTGATLEAAGTAILANGAQRVSGLVFAQA